jgi:hypothetical protein
LHEIWKGRESFSDKKARMDAIIALKQMIRSWLDDTYPSMQESERIAMAEAMDMSLIELKKEEGMRTFYEINNVVRMSFIEMQYMKKVSSVRTVARFGGKLLSTSVFSPLELFCFAFRK